MKTIIVDGLSGSGKWVVSRSLCCLQDVFNLSIDENLENVINYNTLNPNPAFPLFFKQYLHVLNYNKFIGRSINNRKSDFTFSANYPFEKIQNIAKSQQGEIALLKSENKINIYESHGGSLVGLSKDLRELKENIFLIKIKRDPRELIERWCEYVNRYGNDITEFTLFYKFGRKNLVWFVKGFENEFSQAKTPLEKVTIAFKCFSEKNKFAASIASKQSNYLELNFEKFILDPSYFIELVIKKMGINGIDKKRQKIIFNELNIPRINKIEEFGYWKLSNKFDFKDAFHEMRPRYKNLLLQIFNDYTEEKLIL